MDKITIDGRVMWQSSEGERLKVPNEKPDTYGWHRVTVEGVEMWESPEGERVK